MNFAFKTSKQKVYVSSLFMFAWEFLPMLCLKKNNFSSTILKHIILCQLNTPLKTHY